MSEPSLTKATYDVKSAKRRERRKESRKFEELRQDERGKEFKRDPSNLQKLVRSYMRKLFGPRPSSAPEPTSAPEPIKRRF